MASILITGANRGIGAALRAVAEAAGHQVTGTARDISGLAGHWQVLDVTRAEDHAALKAALEQDGLDWLIANAGVYLDKGCRVDTTDPEAMDATFAANVTGVLRTVQTALPALRRGTSPRIAIMSSLMASHTNAPGGSLAYRASKAAATNLARNLATELRGEGIAVGAYHPGWVRTEMGGGDADIDVQTSVEGLMERFSKLTMERSGEVVGHDGEEIPY